MRRIIVTLGLAFSVCGSAGAQQNVAPAVVSGEEAYQAQPATVPRSISGCLYIVNVVGEMPKQYRVMGGDITPFRGKVGHTVVVSGQAGKSDPREMILNYNMLDATTGVGYDTITAESVRDVLSNCSFAGFERSPR